MDARTRANRTCGDGEAQIHFTQLHSCKTRPQADNSGRARCGGTQRDNRRRTQRIVSHRFDSTSARNRRAGHRDRRLWHGKIKACCDAPVTHLKSMSNKCAPKLTSSSKKAANPTYFKRIGFSNGLKLCADATE